ncbi:ATP-dependent RNA helicase DHX30-like [Tachypleus tridentatus]|uniref:ATP-dependent RNA helicase DHX30-like n=1 Tax=Tachypleus tridentatus TaxID=6853 RepID=UPI003FD055AC
MFYLNLSRINSQKNVFKVFPAIKKYCSYFGKEIKSYPFRYWLEEEKRCEKRNVSYYIPNPAQVKVPKIQKEKLTEQFPQPSQLLKRILHEVSVKYQLATATSKLLLQQLPPEPRKQQQWKARLTVTWPQHFVVESTASKKSEAERIVSLLACQKIKELGVLDENNRLTLIPAETEWIPNKKVEVHPKSALSNICTIVCNTLGSKEFKPTFSTSLFKVGENLKGWKAKLTIHWPSTHTVEATGIRKIEAETVAATTMLQWLKQQGVLTKDNHPILYTPQEKKSFLVNKYAPCSVVIPAEIQNQMLSFLQKFQEIKHYFKNECEDSGKESSKLNNKEQNSSHLNSAEADLDILEEEHEGFELNISSSEIVDGITGNQFRSLEPEELVGRSHRMYWNFQKNRKKISFAILEAHQMLPITVMRNEILSAIEKNQVIVLSGEPGCGKTTQVPQFILDDFILHLKGAECNMVVTQPRRISAISIAERVAKERGERTGETVGYQVRLKKVIPQEKGALLFCSTGILLRKFQTNPSLEGISHVIVDEVHERDVQTDFLLILLKGLLKSNPELRVILMSASLNADLFSKYFDNCPIVNVPGFVHNVDEYFLSDIYKILGKRETSNNSKSYDLLKVNYDLIMDLVQHIDSKEPPGAILCFLPGWQEIRAMLEKLKSVFSDSSRYLLCPVHSRLPYNEQQRIFECPPAGMRKIVLATNVAETSITINDVVYVINPGFQKEMVYDPNKGLAVLTTEWITRANLKQRRGRAGRVQPGKCFHLFHKKTVEELREFPIAEILRVPLEKTVLDCKFYCPHTKSGDFLSQALESPSTENISHAVAVLEELGVLSEDEELTPLGRRIAHFTTHPRLSKALVYSTILRCVDTVLTIAALLSSTRDPFVTNLENKAVICEVKKKFDHTVGSDHIALANLFKTWRKEELTSEFCKKNLVSPSNLNFTKGLKRVFSEHLYDACLVDSVDSCEDLNQDHNQYCNNVAMVMGVMVAALYPNVLHLQKGDLQRGRIKWDAVTPMTLNGKPACIQKESVISQEIGGLPSPWLIYFNSMRSQERGMILVRDLSCIPNMALLLFGGEKIEIHHPSPAGLSESDAENNVILKIDNQKRLRFSCSQREAELIMHWRDCLQNIVQSFLVDTAINEDKVNIVFVVNQFLEITKNLLVIEDGSKLKTEM